MKLPSMQRPLKSLYCRFWYEFEFVLTVQFVHTGVWYHEICFSAAVTYWDISWYKKWDTLGSYHTSEQLRLRQTCTYLYSHKNLPYSHTQSLEMDVKMLHNKICSKHPFYLGLCRVSNTFSFIRVRNKKLIFLFLNQNIYCGYSKELSLWAPKTYVKTDRA